MAVAEDLSGNTTVTVEREYTDENEQGNAARRWTGSNRRSKGALPGKTRRNTAKDTPNDPEERDSFINFLMTSSEKNKAETFLVEAKYQTEVVRKVMIEAQQRLLETQQRRELLEIKKLEKELGNTD